MKRRASPEARRREINRAPGLSFLKNMIQSSELKNICIMDRSRDMSALEVQQNPPSYLWLCREPSCKAYSKIEAESAS